METKFKYEDKVRVITTPNVIGELIDVKPLYLKDGIPVYTYIMHTIDKGFREVRDIDIVKYEEETPHE